MSYQDYLTYYDSQNKIELAYGKKSVIIMHIGSFYEILGIDLPDKKIGNITEICKILGIKQTMKNTHQPHSLKNPMLAGFPLNSLSKHINVLLKNDYYVQVYNQIDDGGKKKKRVPTAIFSPATFLDDESDTEGHKSIMCIRINWFKDMINKCKTSFASISIINFNTGSIYLYEIYNTYSDKTKIQTELVRLISSYHICEILVIGSEIDFLPENIRINIRPPISDYYKIEYQTLFFETLKLTIHPSWSPDLLGVCVHLTSYIKEQLSSVVNNLKNPILLEEVNNLILNHDSVSQLHLFSQTKFSLFNIINNTKTCMGERLLRFRLVLPEINVEILEERYNQIERMSPYYNEFREILKNIIDIEKKYRKWVTSCVNPYEFENLYQSFLLSKQILILNKKYKIIPVKKEIITEFDKFITDIENTFDIELLKNREIEKSYFKTLNKAIDGVFKNINKAFSILNQINNEITLLIGSSKLEKTDKEGYYISITKSKFKLLGNFEIKFNFRGKEYVLNQDNITKTVLTNTIKIGSDSIKMLSDEIEISREQVLETINKEFNKKLTEYLEKYGEIIIKIGEIIAEIDVIQSNSFTSLKNSYVRPQIIDEKNGESYIVSTNLRHPIIEFFSEFQYEPNDIELGLNEIGILLTGLNLSGKSSFIRSIGLNVVLAQAGIFVAAESFIYYPYKRLVSKISIKDDPEHNKSTFFLEVEEIQDICERADKNCLVLLDETCSSTEVWSAAGIVTALITFLIEKKANFIISSHNSFIFDLQDIKNNPNLGIFHFETNIKDGKININRKLKKGAINKLYGIEICANLGLDNNFIKKAFQYRNELLGETGEIYSKKRSRYNSKLYIDSCVLCGSKKNLETHHIIPQKDANSHGIIDYFNKNKKFNLMVLCSECHDKLHS